MTVQRDTTQQELDRVLERHLALQREEQEAAERAQETQRRLEAGRVRLDEFRRKYAKAHPTPSELDVWMMHRFALAASDPQPFLDEDGSLSDAQLDAMADMFREQWHLENDPHRGSEAAKGAPQHGGSTAKTDPFTVVFRVQKEVNEEPMFFMMRLDSPFRRLFKKYCTRRALADCANWRFLFQDRAIGEDATPRDLGLTEADVVYVVHKDAHKARTSE